MDLMIVVPEPGMHKEIAQVLLALAGDPSEVQTELTPSLSFRVPQPLYELFVEVMKALRLAEAVKGRPVPEELAHLEGMSAAEAAAEIWKMPLDDLKRFTEEAEAAVDADEPAEAAAPKRRGRPARKQAAEGETE